VSITISSTIVEKIRDVWRAPLKFRVSFKSVELAEKPTRADRASSLSDFVMLPGSCGPELSYEFEGKIEAY
jgi:hypothetical protein